MFLGQNIEKLEILPVLVWAQAEARFTKREKNMTAMDIAMMIECKRVAPGRLRALRAGAYWLFDNLGQGPPRAKGKCSIILLIRKGLPQLRQ